jgi:UDP-N-acetylglucosamine 1-carboxyvinyltransferase
MGAEVELGYGRAQHRTTICAAESQPIPKPAMNWSRPCAPPHWSWDRWLRAVGHARVSIPGGCAIGARPIDLHIKGLEKLGAKSCRSTATSRPAPTASRARKRFRQDHRHRHGRHADGCLWPKAKQSCKTARASPRSSDLAALLVKMGAKIEGAGTATIRVKGVSKLSGARHRIIPTASKPVPLSSPERMTGGDLMLTDCDPSHLGALLSKLHEVGVKTKITRGSVRVMGDAVHCRRHLQPKSIPAFPPTCRRSSWR